MKSLKTFQIVFMTFFGMLGSILVGLIFFNSSVFITSMPSFQFVTSGFYGALFFSLLEYRPRKEQIFTIIIILIMNLIIFTGRHFSFAYLIRDIFYLGGLFLALKLYHLFINKNTKIKFYFRSFALVLFYGLINCVFIGLVYIINAKSGIPPFDFIFARAKEAVLVGLGLGVGIDFYFRNKEYLFSKFKINTV